jgi:phosphatidylserine/phosphatidylglycerophosphate/cardiolipin synthase-like enzyme
MKTSLPVFAVLIAALSACARPLLPAPANQNFMPVELSRQSAASAGAISVHFVKAYKGPIAENEPLTRQDPNSPAAALLELINSARVSLEGAFYDFSAPEIAEAFIRAQQRGVKVRIVTDTDNMTERDSGPQGPIRGVIKQMMDAGIPVVADQRSAIMHHKFLVQDGQTVWMGSTNLTPTSLYQHNNNALVLRIPQLAANYTTEFNRMFVDRLFGPNPPRQIPYPVIQTGNTTIRTFFSPRGGGREAVLEAVQKARREISFMAFSFTDKDLASLMVLKHNAGLRVEGVFDQCLGYGKYSQYHTLRASKIYSRMDGNQALLHHKILIADDTVITGSYNFSTNADSSNNENMILIRNATVSTQFRQEYERVMRAAKYNNPPEGRCPGQDNTPDPADPNGGTRP